MQSGRRRDLWQALTPLQQSEALRLTVAVIASAVSGSARAVASCLAEAGRVAPQVEAHVLWAARELTGPMRLVGDTESESSRWLEEGARVRAKRADAIERPEHIVARARAEAEEERLLAAKRAELEAQGLRVLAWAEERLLLGRGKLLEEMVDDRGEVFTAQTHASCPGHVAVVHPKLDWNSSSRRVVGVSTDFWCDDWRAHGHRNRWARNTSGATSGPMEEEQCKAMDAANGVRRQWIQDQLLTVEDDTDLHQVPGTKSTTKTTRTDQAEEGQS